MHNSFELLSVFLKLDRFGKEPVRDVRFVSGGNLLAYLCKHGIDLLDHHEDEQQWDASCTRATRSLSYQGRFHETAVSWQGEECTHPKLLLIPFMYTSDFGEIPWRTAVASEFLHGTCVGDFPYKVSCCASAIRRVLEDVEESGRVGSVWKKLRQGFVDPLAQVTEDCQ